MYDSDIRHQNAALQNKLRFLYTLNRNKTIDLGFRPPYLDLLAAFDNPHLKLPPVVHVAGTNGKGSTIAIMRSILEAAGHKVHVYTSPHLVRFNERIVLAGQVIDDESLMALVDEALTLNRGREVTFFEITTAMAFAAFSRVQADVVLLETGLGGRLDCTNVIEKPAVTVITNVGYDHMEFLGKTLPDIAREKGGIMKRDAPCVLGFCEGAFDRRDLFSVLNQVSKEKQSDLYRCNDEWFIEPKNGHIAFTFDGFDYVYPRPALTGQHQIKNAGTALAAIHILRENNVLAVPDTSIGQGLKTVSWPARLQCLMHNGVKDVVPSGWSLWLDGGHNADAGRVLADQVRAWCGVGQGSALSPVHLIIGMMAHKDPEGFLDPILLHVDSVTCVNITGEPKSLTAQALRGSLSGVRADVVIDQADDWRAAVARIVERGGPPGHILIAGSLYLAGQVLSDLE